MQEYDRICKDRRHDPMIGCDKQVLDAMKITCVTSRRFTCHC